MAEKAEAPEVILARMESTIAEIRERGGDDDAGTVLFKARAIMHDRKLLSYEPSFAVVAKCPRRVSAHALAPGEQLASY